MGRPHKRRKYRQISKDINNLWDSLINKGEGEISTRLINKEDLENGSKIQNTSANISKNYMAKRDLECPNKLAKVKTRKFIRGPTSFIDDKGKDEFKNSRRKLKLKRRKTKSKEIMNDTSKVDTVEITSKSDFVEGLYQYFNGHLEKYQTNDQKRKKMG